VARILVIDDDPDIRGLLETALSLSGHDVICAADGVEALALHRATPADIVIVDIFMPEKEGIETIIELRQEWPALPIIAMSGGGTSGNRNFLAQALQLGATRAVQKPFDYTEVLAMVTELLARRSG
jgi:DNA-binding response OmpR family regulator